MFLNTWSIGLCLLSIIVLFLMVLASRTSVNVLLYWDPSSDSNRQIRLENETWLASSLVQNAMVLQVVSVILFVLAADKFSAVITGAMCATGSLLANAYGMPTLYVKLVGVFLYGFWIVLHKLDISRANYPLLRVKYIYLMALLPFMLLDIGLQSAYLYNLHPNIITSCCAVVYSEGQGGGMNLIGSMPKAWLLGLFYGTVLLLYGLGVIIYKRKGLIWQIMDGAIWLFFIVLSLVAITSVFSSYVYAMPYHHCPFCILKPQYHYIGFLIYLTLFPAAFFGLSGPVLEIFNKGDLRPLVSGYQRLAVKLSLALMTIFIITVSYHYIVYNFLGGER